MMPLLLPFDRPDDPGPPMPVELAIARGQQIVNRPVKLLIAGGVILALLGFQRSLWFVLAAPLGWIAGWCWWSYAAPRWRTWAIARGTDPRALQWYAEKGNLLWPKGHWGERTEFGSRSLRRSQQPAEPYRGDSGISPTESNLSPGFVVPPSNGSFLLGVAFWTIAMPVGRLVLNLFVEQPEPVSDSLFTGLLTGILLAAIAYRNESWRSAVSPEHAFGLGIVGALLLVAIMTKGDEPLSVLQLVLGTLLLMAPTYLLVASTAEWRRRKSPHE
jgi:hypothetical protein